MKKITLLIAFACMGAFSFYACKKDSNNSTTVSCSDGIQNQGETGIDCGGPCTACGATATCSDGIQNQGETGIDCGGPCPACLAPSCSDGIKNQNETDIDCGGVCPACPLAAMTCLVDNLGWAAGSSSRSVSITTSGVNTFTRLIGIQTSGTTVSQIAIGLQGNLALNTSYNIVTPPTGILITDKKYLKSVGGIDTTFTATAGTIKFTRLDTVNDKASGSFSGTFKYTVGGTFTKQITNGIFTNITLTH